MSDSVIEPLDIDEVAARARANAFEKMLESLEVALDEAHAAKAESITVRVVDVASLFLSHEKLLETLTNAAQNMMAIDGQAQALTNLLAAMVLRYGGEVRMSAEELATTHGAKLGSALDPTTMEQVVTVTRVDPDTGDEVRPSRIIVPGKLPLSLR